VPEDTVLVDEVTSELSLSLSESELKQVALAKEFSQVLGEVMKEKQSRIELAQLIEHMDSFGDAVTLSAILDDPSGMAPSELSLLKNLENNPSFRKRATHLSESLLDYTLANLSNYSLIEKSFDSYLSDAARQNANVSAKEVLKEFYSSQGLVVHIPYEEKFDWDVYDNVITTTYDPIARNDWNEGFLYNTNNARISSTTSLVRVPVVDDDYSFENPTLVVTYYYEDDFIMNDPSTPSLPTPAPNSVILAANVDDRSITQEDILSTNLPEMQLTSNDYIGLFGTKTKVRIFRGSNDLKVNFDGTVGSSADGQTFRYDQVDFSKDDARFERWKAVNMQFDPDWDMSENSQQLFLFTEHNLTATGKAEGSVKVGYDFIAKKATAEATTSVNVEVELGGSRFRVNGELVRRAVMNTIVGDTGHGTRLRNGIDYNVKPIGHLRYYFEHRYTNFPD
jgi:hypothetical protein